MFLNAKDDIAYSAQDQSHVFINGQPTKIPGQPHTVVLRVLFVKIR
jgi:hypothetical protein